MVVRIAAVNIQSPFAIASIAGRCRWN